MSQDEFSVLVELDDVLVQVDDPSVDVEIVSEPDVEVVLAGNLGPRGLQGIQGEKGDRGDPGNDIAFRYVHDQGIPSSSWSVAHNLDGFPNVTVVDSAGTTVEGGVEYIDNNNIVLHFSAIFSGKAYLS